MSRKALGKGIGALLGENDTSDASSAIEVSLAALKPNPHQPRRSFGDETLRELADSIREKGVLQPILVEQRPDGAFTIIAGERRARAAEHAGLKKIPAIVRRFNDQEKLEIALVENVQREDLSPLEEARAFRQLLEMANLSQDQVAQKVGKDRSTIANSLRLLRLPEKAQKALDAGSITAGHARALLMLSNPADMEVLLNRVVENGISVRAAEEAAAAMNEGRRGAGKGARAGRGQTPRRDPHIREIEQDLIERLGTKVDLRGNGKKGHIVISYFSADDLERLLQLLSKR